MADTFDANTAKTYATVGLVFYGLATLLEILGVITLAWELSQPWNRSSDVPIVVMWLSIPILLSIIFSIWAFFAFRKIDEGNYVDARSSALIVGIFGLGLGGFLGGVFFLLAYMKLGDVLRYAQQPAQQPAYTVKPVHTSTRVCVNCGRIADGNKHYCAYCGSKLPE